jgi:hypothetical protein
MSAIYLQYITNKSQFFGQNDGCSDRNCPFLHDREAVLADRADILEKRRKAFSGKPRPTYRQSVLREVLVKNYLSGGDKALGKEIQNSGLILKDVMKDKAYCSNPRCLMPWKKGDKNPLKACQGCKYTLYCSVSVL